LNTNQQVKDPEADPMEDLKRLEVTDLEESIQERNCWRLVTVAAITPAEL